MFALRRTVSDAKIQLSLLLTMGVLFQIDVLIYGAILSMVPGHNTHASSNVPLSSASEAGQLASIGTTP